ncbi:MAG: Nif3-like dinuclear metal center hexameric protein [Saprospiraceae bacterium]
MKIHELIAELEAWAPPQYAESYDNTGLITGHPDQEITGVLICLDSTEMIIEEAVKLGYNMIIAHHPIVFKGLKKLNGTTYVERAVIKAIKNDIALYAIHTNLDNVITGVNHQIADILALQHQQVLAPKAVFASANVGSGLIGQLANSVTEHEFLNYLKRRMQLPMIKHTRFLNKLINKVAVCGGTGSFLIPDAIKAGADVFITADLKYHEYFDAEQSLILMDIGHFESERFTIELILKFINEKFPGLRAAQTALITNPVQYFL